MATLNMFLLICGSEKVDFKEKYRIVTSREWEGQKGETKEGG